MIGREDIRRYLGDRQWHTGVELIEHFTPLIPPEQASQEFYKTRKKAANSEIPVDAAVRKGGELVVSSLVSSLIHSGLVETKGGKPLIERSVRWTAWYCWLCGYQVLTSYERPETGLCPTCEDGLCETPEERGIMHISVLSKPQIVTLRKCEAVIERGQKTFLEVGRALLEIKEQKLFLEYESFPDYCRERWGFQKNYANRLIASAKIVESVVEAVPMGTTLPTTERQVRPLAGLAPEAQAEVWQAAVETSHERNVPVTAAIVQEVAASYAPEEAPAQEPVQEAGDEEGDEEDDHAADETDDEAEPEELDEDEPADEPAVDFSGCMNGVLEDILREFDPPNDLIVRFCEEMAAAMREFNPPTALVATWLDNKALQFR